MAFTYNETNNIFTGVIWSGPNTGPGGASGPIVITQDGVISNATSHAMLLYGGYYTITVNGQVNGGTYFLGSGIELGDTAVAGVHKVDVGNTGSVYGTQNGILSTGSLDIKNAGTIGGVDCAICLPDTGVDYLSLLNSGSIFANSSSFAIKVTGAGQHTIGNSGDITGDILFEAGVLKLTNSGRIAGSIDLADGKDTVTNTGHITQDVALGGGINSLSNSGTIAFGIFAGNEADTVTNSGTTAMVFLNNGANKFTNSGRLQLAHTTFR